MPTTAGCPNHPACALEPHAQQLPEGGDREGERAPWLGGAVPGAPADDGTPHPGREQVVEGPMAEGEGPGDGEVEAGPSKPGREGGTSSLGQGPGWLLIAPKHGFLFSFPSPRMNEWTNR